ncbi:MAG: FtsX-like permease family protein, partial [Blastocatellia bacterium]
TREIGVRIALGANARDVIRLVMVRAALQVAAGLAIGITGSIALSRVLRDLLYNVGQTDPYTYAAVALVLAGAALAASFIPALRAAKVAPMIALRTE